MPLNILYVSLVLLAVYLICFFKRKEKSILLSLIMIIIFIPKINLIEVSRMTTAGIRFDDFLILIAFLYIAFFKRLFKNRIINYGVSIMILLVVSQVMSMIFGIIYGYNTEYLYSILTIVRKVEYFVLIFIGFFALREDENGERLFFKEFTIFNAVHLLFALLQVVGVLGYSVFGSTSDDFFAGKAVSTFNGYYEYGVYLAICIVYYLVYFKNNIAKVMLIISAIMLFLSDSRTALFALVIALVFALVYSCIKKATLKKIGILLGSLVGVIVFITIIDVFDVNIFNFGRFTYINVSSMFDKFTYYISRGNFKDYAYIVQTRNEGNIVYAFNDSDYSSTYRFFKWGAVLDGFKQYPLLGYGPGVTHVVDGNYLRILGETGIVGTALWLYLLIYFMRYFSVNDEHNFARFALFSIMVVLGAAVFLDIFDASKIMEFLWFIIGFGIMMVSKSKESETIEIETADD